MGRGPCTCCSNSYLNRGPWTPQEDEVLMKYIKREGDKGNWRKVPKAAGLLRCGKSCRLRWLNYLRPDIKRGKFSEDETDLIIRLHSLLGNRWSIIAGRVPGRSDNEIKNYWNFHLSKKLLSMGIDPKSHRPLPSLVSSSRPIKAATNDSTTRHSSISHLSSISRNASFSSTSSTSPSSSSLEACSHSSGISRSSASRNDVTRLFSWNNIMSIEVLDPNDDQSQQNELQFDEDDQEQQQQQQQRQEQKRQEQQYSQHQQYDLWNCSSESNFQSNDDDLHSNNSNNVDHTFVGPEEGFDVDEKDEISTLTRGEDMFSLDFLDAPLIESDGLLEFLGSL